MATATPFTALGQGNGFPFCLNHRTEAQIAARETSGGSQRRLRLDGTLGEIMAIFWNLYSFQIDADISIPTPATSSISETLFFDEGGDFGSLYEDEYGVSPIGIVDVVNEPMYRCVFNEVIVEGFWFEPSGDGNNTSYSFYPEFYYNTTSENYCIVFDFQIEIDEFFTGFGDASDVYTSNEALWEGSIPAKTVNIFGQDYELYSQEGQITITSITIADNYFTY